MDLLLENFKAYFKTLAHSVNFDSLPIIQKFLVISFAIVAVVLLYQLGKVWLTKRRHYYFRGLDEVPGDMVVESQVLLTKEEITLYNLVHLAVRDSYLLLAKIPLRCLIQVHTKNDVVRRDFLRSIQKIRADFVLVHPGTLISAKVILIDKNEEMDHPISRNRLIGPILREAEIEVIWLQANINYSVPQLTERLGLAPEE